MGRLRTWAWLLCALALPALARAETPSSVERVRLVVPTARGKASYGGSALTKAVRRGLETRVKKLVSAKKFGAARKKLKQKGKAKWTIEALSDAAREVDADYVLSLEITKEKWMYTAHARLIEVATGKVQMNFRSQYFRPKEDAEDRGGRIAARTLQKLEEILAPTARAPASDPVAVFGPSEEREAQAERQAEPEEEVAAAKPPDKSGPGDLGARGSTARDLGARGSTARDLGARGSETRETETRVREGRASREAVVPKDETTSAEVEVPAASEEDEEETVRLSVLGGADLLRSYDLASASGADSRLSYSLEPLAMVGASAEARLAEFPLGLALRGSFRPVRFEVKIDGDAAAGQQDAPATPAGRIIDMAALLQAPLRIGGEGRLAYRLIPGAGLHFSSLSVDRHRANVIVSNRALAPVASVLLRLPLAEFFELDLGLEGGPMVSYTESPGKSGTRVASAFTLSANVRASFWLSDLVAVTLDTRFDYDRVRFSGVPSRYQPESENLIDVSAVTQDLLTGVGVAFRL